MAESYRVPPVVECVIEIKFQDPIAFDAIEKKRSRFERHYPRHDLNVDIQAHISLEQNSITQSPSGIRFRSDDELQILMIQTSGFAAAQLAPYPGWEAFRKRFDRDYELHQEQFGRHSISRIGVRFINRIDIPASEVSIQDYLNIFPVAPPLGASLGLAFALETTRQLEDRRYLTTLRTSTVASPVPQMLSFLLDIDLFREVELPQRHDHLMVLLDEMRDIKNYIFESSITPTTRKLFQ